MFNKKIRISLCVISLFISSIIVFLYWPGNDYIRNALLNGMPKIDQYSSFNNAVVKAGEPQYWKYAKGAKKRKISDSAEVIFNNYKTTAYLVIQNDSIVLEQYWDGYQDSLWSNSFSMAKSIVSLLVGCAIDDGFIKNVEQAVSDFYPGNWVYKPDNYIQKTDTLRLRHLLTMSAGFDWKESSSSLFSTTTQIYYGGDLSSVIDKAKFKEQPGIKFEYQSGATQLLAFVLKSAIGRSIASYASEKLWIPLGAEEDALWSTDKKGMEKAYCCFNSNARDFARIGKLVMQKGVWNGIQIIDSNYIQQSINPASYLTFNDQPCTFYGYQFWIMNYKDFNIPYCRGILGQYIFIIPELDMIVVRLGHMRDKKRHPVQDYTMDAELWVKTALDIIFHCHQ